MDLSASHALVGLTIGFFEEKKKRFDFGRECHEKGRKREGKYFF
jgi:hypothetical protein